MSAKPANFCQALNQLGIFDLLYGRANRKAVTRRFDVPADTARRWIKSGPPIGRLERWAWQLQQDLALVQARLDRAQALIDENLRRGREPWGNGATGQPTGRGSRSHGSA